MIGHEWRSSLDEGALAEVRALVGEAAEYDDEAGFSRVVPTSAAGVRHLLVRIQPPHEEDQDWPLAAYLRLEVADGVGTVGFVVRPEFRSLGVATLTFEKLGLPPGGPDGWCGSGAMVLTAWAHGDHPAADRMARRFGATPARRMWQLVKPLHEADEPAPPPTRQITVRTVDELGGNGLPGRARRLDRMRADGWVSPRGQEHLLAGSELLVALTTSDEVLGTARISSGNGNGVPRRSAGALLTLGVAGDAGRAEVARVLLRSGVDRLRRGGLAAAKVYVDAESELIVRLTRELSFEHDRSDVCYRIG